MFGLMKNKKEDFELVYDERKNFLSILGVLSQLLNQTSNNAQAEFIRKLIELIEQQNISLFIKMINGVDMWGGAGAVWEVYIANKSDAEVFENEILKLINLMEQTKILGKGIKPIRKIFDSNLKNDNSIGSA